MDLVDHIAAAPGPLVVLAAALEPLVCQIEILGHKSWSISAPAAKFQGCSSKTLGVSQIENSRPASPLLQCYFKMS